MASNDVRIVVGALDNASPELDKLRVELDDLGRKSVEARADVNTKEGKLKLDQIDAKLASVGARLARPNVTVAGAARAQADLAGVDLALDRVEEKSAHINLGGLSSGAKALGLAIGGSGLLSIASPLAAAGVAMGAFGAVAVPVLSRVQKAQQSLTTAQKEYADATTKQGKQNALLAEQTATLGLTKAEQQMMGTLDDLKLAFLRLGNAMSPVIETVLKLGLALLTALMPTIKTLVKAGGDLITGMLTPFLGLIKSPAWDQFTQALAKMAVQMGPVLGQTLTGLLKLFMQLFIQTMPAGLQILKILLPLIVQMATDLVPVIAAVANVIAISLEWLAKNHLLVVAIGVLGAALLALGIALDTNPVGLFITAIALLTVAIVELAKHWQQIWGDIRQWTKDAIDFVKGLFNELPGPLKDVLKIIGTVWKQEWDDISAVAKVVWAAIKAVVKDAWDVIAALLKVGLAVVTGNWKAAWNAISDLAHQVWNNLKDFLKSAWDSISSLAKQTWNNMESAARSGFNAIKTVAQTVWGDIVSFFRGMPGKVVGALNGLGTKLGNFGHQAMEDLFGGFRSVASDIKSWFSNFISDVENLFKKLLGINSPSTVFFDIGKNTMIGLKNGIEAHAKSAAKAAEDAAKNAGGGAGAGNPGGSGAQNAALAKKMYPAWASGNNWRMWNFIAMAESGWNDLAMNPSGAFGIAQALGHGTAADRGTKSDSYGGYGLSHAGARAANSGNAGSQITWMHNYILSRYGSLQAAYNYHVATGVYDSGGWLPTGASIAINKTGRPERILGPNDAMNIQIQVVGGDSEFSQFMANWIRKYTRITGGGNVQKAFGVAGR